MYLNLKDYASFENLDIAEKNDIEKELESLNKKSKDEKWYVSSQELNICEKPFAEGGFSEIYDCDWRGLRIAVKKPKQKEQKQISTILNVMKEIQVWNTVRHPNIVQFLGISKLNNEIVILLERIHGWNLRTYIEKRNYFQITFQKNKTNKTKIIRELVSVFYFLHYATPTIIYRDLKPENILISFDGHLKLTDLGLSKFIENDNADNFKMTGYTGTPRWMAPEVFKGENYNISSDIYSLGMIISYITTEKLPFRNFSCIRFNQFMNGDEEIKVQAPKKYRYIVNKCVQRKANLRPDVEAVYYYLALKKPFIVS